MKLNNNAIAVNFVIALILSIIGGINIIFWLIGGIGAYTDAEIDFSFAELVLALVLAGLGAWMLCCGIIRFNMGKKAKNYANIIGNVPMISIANIAGSVRAAERQVEKDFQWLIKKNFLVDAYIDYNQKAIIFKDAYREMIEQKQQEEQARKQIVYVSVVCTCCNGTTEIESGKAGKCSYCGAPIKA